MSSRQVKKKFEVIDKVTAMLGERLEPATREAAQRFARAFYAGLGPEDLLAIPVEDLYGSLLCHWQLGYRYKGGPATVRVYNPNFEEHGWQSTHTVVEVVTNDMPFLVDSVGMEMNRHGLTVHLIVHPVIAVRRNRKGEIVDVVERDVEGADVVAEAMMRFEVDRQSDPELLKQLKADVERVLRDVFLTVEDWQPMRQRMLETIAALKKNPPPVSKREFSEGLDFLSWIADGNFTFIASRDHDLATLKGEDVLKVVPASGLGVSRDSGESGVSESFSQIAPELRTQARAKSLLIITKSTARSTVHRPAHLDYIGVKRFDKTGEVCGEMRFLGLYSSLAYSTRPVEIPLLRGKYEQVIKRSGQSPNSHASKALQNILDNFPRDEMFQASADELFQVATGILQVQERHRLRLFMRRDVWGRFVTALVYVPRDRYNTEFRLRMQNILTEALEGESSEFNVQFSESILARVHFIIRTAPDKSIDYDDADLEARMTEAMQSWDDRLQAALLENVGEAEGTQLANRYSDAFPVAYQHDFSERTAAVDIVRLEELGRGQPLLTHLYRPLEGPADLLRFKVYGHRTHMALSDVLPMLERMGMRVIEARPYEIHPHGGQGSWILDFDMNVADKIELDVLKIKGDFQDAFLRVCSNDVENDGFNRLVLMAGLGWRDVLILRAVCKYLRQIRIPFSQSYIERSMTGNPHISRMLVALFHARLDPDAGGDTAAKSDAIQAEILEAMDGVANLDEDRILRRYLHTILAILRTNYYQIDDNGQPRGYMSFKLDPRNVPELPEPKPMFEIFVYSPWTEGAHLRGGKVARGGLRWSDRMEDFRTEILGLVKAQMVKNSVIVPVGSKGGFIAKQLPRSNDRDVIQKEVVRCYRTFISGLLDITDNLAGGKVVPPPRVVRHDEDDPYLVVAADKGTATFSDIANELSLQYGFWMGDAFASGGSAGYDHKAMGITARGGWESVKRHFRELGVDIQSTPFSVVGVGDMAGDVFGNGMLLSEQIRLMAAFNHMHIFVDPDPDPASSFKERKRLFELPRSSWRDYDSKLISKGGGVFERSAKSIKLSAQAREALGIEAEDLTPNDVIRAILQAPVDLFWNGGIGTYVKARSETHDDVGDRANDSVRVNGSELRCRVVGEGGNLGLTQLGRIEFASSQGGLINTDAIDNAGGVDCSDNEVNIKILLDAVIADGDMTLKQRNKLLVDMTDEVAGLVLRHNYLQTQALSIVSGAAAYLLGDQVRMIHSLEHAGRLDRELEFLPSDEELTERGAQKQGLWRPEVSVLLAYSKMKVYDDLLATDIAEDPDLSKELQLYFPKPLQERFAKRMELHPLRREIIVTSITNSMVNRMGPTFCPRLEDATGESPGNVARAYTVARDVFALREVWAAIEALDNKIAVAAQLEMFEQTIRLVDRATMWLMRNRRSPIEIGTTVAQFAPGVASIASKLPQLVRGEGLKLLNSQVEHFRELGASKQMAQRMAGILPIYSALDIVEVASGIDQDTIEVAEAYFGLAVTLELPWLVQAVNELERVTHWQQQARRALRDELFAGLRTLTAGFMPLTSGGQKMDKRIDAWLEVNANSLTRYQNVLADLKAASSLDLAMLSVAAREFQNLARTDFRQAL
jgi:glutamate dehydrogenase